MSNTETRLSKEVLDLLAKREDARAAIRDAEALLVQKRAEVSRLAAEIIRKDDTGVAALKVARW